MQVFLKSAGLVALAVLVGALPAAYLTWLDAQAGSQTPLREFAAYFHPLFSLSVALLLGYRMLRGRHQGGDMVIALVILFATLAASPSRVPFALYPFTTLILLGVLTSALAALQKSANAT
ncbi:hypothetical protein [Deinococcus aluminii]|uniref:DUF4345 domain-containing protein n=1 Tax=Deinococcus aluminii TaxID=1656885 RepID=A0ABP9XFI7_9DEIO